VLKKSFLIGLSVLLVATLFLLLDKKCITAYKSTSNKPGQTITSVGFKPSTKAASKQVQVNPIKPGVSSKVIGIYSTSWIAGSKRMEELIRFIKETKVNAIVIDVKDDTGVISYPSSVPLAQEIGATSKRAPAMKELVARLKQENIYTIARIVVFKDPILANKHLELAVKNKGGGIWRDRKGMIWVDPNCEKVWKYNLDVAKEAIAMGFSEIQFDYVRFLSDGKISQAVYPYSKGDSKEDVIRNFLLYAKKDINALGVPLSADIFGLVLTVPDDLNIGQKLEKIADAVDIISPMTYPSHYPRGTFGIEKPDLHPYEVIDQAMKDGLKRLNNHKVKIRPWLQDFNLGSVYGRKQLQDQIKALADNGIYDYLFWNPNNRYDSSKY
jgi:hypothetical protein